MSDVNASDTTIINAKEDIFDLYLGVGEKPMKTGLEVELAFIDPSSDNLTPMSVEQNKALKRASNAACSGTEARNEPTSEMLEIGSKAGTAEQLEEIINNAQTHINCLCHQALLLGLKRSYFQNLPDKTAQNLLSSIMDVERYQAFFSPPRDDMKGIAAYFSVCKSNQVSISYKDPDFLLKNLKRLYALAPFLFMLTDNTAPFNEAKPFPGHAGMHHRHSLEKRGGVPEYLYTSNNGIEYLENHIDHVMNNPLFVHYNQEGKLIRLPTGTFESFNSLRDKGLNTATNYYFSQSVLWPDVKIAALKDSEENVIGHRYEARMFGVGIHQHASAQLITAALAFDESFAQKIDELLIDTGFNINQPLTLKTPLESAYKAAREHNQQYLNIAYGNDTMQNFAIEFAGLLEQSKLLENFGKYLEPILTICRTGYTDSKVNALIFDTLEKTKAFQQSYDPSIFNKANKCAYQLFEEQIKALETNAG